ncbi:S8 family peptidase [Candidatus Parcubacteria bacterium]|nr:S8 family peptidase [Candidatus Parcubacteria bacterium]
MKKKFSILVVSIVIAGISLSLVGMALVSQAASEPLVTRKIVVFQSGINESAKEALIKNFGGEKIKELPLVNGMAVLLSLKAEKALAERTGVLRIDNDDLVFVLRKPVCGNGIIEGGEKCGEPGLLDCSEGQICENCKCITLEESIPQPDEEMAWGVNRIDADHIWAETWDQTTLPVTKIDANTGQRIKVAIIDSGIDLDHPDLNVVGGYNAINSRKSYNDDFRHGTHVAGIVAALDNEIGVIGTAPKVELYAVKVLNRRGIGFASDIIDGLQWCINNGIQVVNMSIGSSGSSQSYHDAIIAAYKAEITIVAAAGNNGETGGNIVWPARWPETIAVSATNINDKLAYFSSYGLEIDLAAPGQDINSTWNDGYYHLGSGTSMATPHVTGTVALVIASGKASTPDQVRQVLKESAENIWLDAIYQGAGLIDAEAATSQ